MERTDAMQEPAVRRVCVKWREPQDEWRGLARTVRRVLHEGDAKPDEVLVAVPNALWAKHAAAALQRQRLAVAMVRSDGAPDGQGADDARRCVAVGPLAAAVARRPRVLLVAGAVEGMFAADADQVRAAFDAVGEALVVSTFQQMDSAAAKALGLPARRMRADHGRKVVACAPARVLRLFADELPPTTSGEQQRLM